MLERLKNYRFSKRSVPIAIFVLCALAFGPLMSQLGFYWDDWPVIQTIHLKADLWEFYAYNRPASAWTQSFFAPILGTSPLRWHLFAEGAWVLTAISCWWVLDQLWPVRKRETTAMALLFAIHPLFLLHSIAVAFSQQYLTFLLFFISFGAMLAALRNPQRFWFWTVIGLLATAIHTMTMEYFWGLELARPILIWIVLSENDSPNPSKRLQTFKAWWPYLLVLSFVVIWRMFFVTLLEDDPNELILLKTIADEPVTGILQFAQTVLSDFVYMMALRWSETILLENLNLLDIFSLFVWGMALLAGAGTMVFFKKFEGVHFQREQKQTIGLGVLMLLVGGSSAWLAGRSVTLGLYADRFTLPALLGVVILMIGLIGLVVRPRWQPVVLALLVALSVSTHLRVQNDFRWDWVKQQRAFWQFYWRVPALEAHTTIFSDGTLFRYTGGYPTASAMNVLYPQRDDNNEMDYWFLELDRGYFRILPEMIAERYPVEADFRQYRFSSSSRQSVVVYYAPEEGNCLWVMRETDQFNPDLPSLTKEAVPLSNVNQILTDSPATLPDPQVFGEEPAHTWCYFYQKAELARQQEDWAAIVRLAEESASQGFAPNNRLEWLPFVEGFAHTGDWDQATELTLSAWRAVKSARNLYCPVWRGFEREELDAPEGIFAEVYEQLECEIGVEE